MVKKLNLNKYLVLLRIISDKKKKRYFAILIVVILQAIAGIFENLSVISLERFKIDQRLRHFALNKNNKLFQNENYFYISVDGDGIYKMKFDNFR